MPPSAKTAKSLDIAACLGQVEVTREFSRHGVDLDAACDNTGSTTLHHAARLNRPGAIDALVDAGASITTQAWPHETIITPLNYAACFLALEAMAALLRHGASVGALAEDDANRKCEPPLHCAAENG